MSRLLEQLLTLIDFNMPWLLNSLQTLEQAFPFSLRLLVAAALTLWLVWSRQRQDENWSAVRVKSRVKRRPCVFML